MRKVLSYFYRLLFCIPPLEQRPPKRFILNQFAVPGYDPKSVESYILYKSFMFAVWMFICATVLYAFPLALRDTTWAGFHIFADIYGNLPKRPVDYYKYSFPETVSLPLVGLTCIYAIVLSYATRRQHDWHFSATRPTYLKSIAAIKRKWFGFSRLVLIHVVFPVLLAICAYYMWAALDAWNLYILLLEIHDFSAQTVGSFLLISFVYLCFLLCVASVIAAFVALLFFEKLNSTTTSLMPIFRKGKSYD